MPTIKFINNKNISKKQTYTNQETGFEVYLYFFFVSDLTNKY